MESSVKVENWHEERDRLVNLLHSVECGIVTHVDQADERQLQKASGANIAELKERLATLNDRLGDSTG